MSLARARRRNASGAEFYWPGFVDALSTLLLGIVFLIAIFALAQFFSARDSAVKDDVSAKLSRRIQELTDMLGLERAGNRTMIESIGQLSATLDLQKAEAARLTGDAAARRASGAESETRAEALRRELSGERSSAAQALQQVELVNQQLAALRRQLAALEQALETAESREKESQTRISDLGSRLNVALAQRVQELTRYRSDFFGRLRQILGNRPGVQIAGDRFVFQSEVLFDAGQAALGQGGRPDLDRLAQALIELEKEIPPDIAWVMRVDGHTDRRPIQSAQFPSNWALSSARAIAVVQYLAGRGVSPQRLAATGFGEFQPADTGDGDEAFRRNRRIELKLTER